MRILVDMAAIVLGGTVVLFLVLWVMQELMDFVVRGFLRARRRIYLRLGRS